MTLRKSAATIGSPWKLRCVVITSRSGANINAQNADGDTAAHLAAILHNLSLLTILLQAGSAPFAHPTHLMSEIITRINTDGISPCACRQTLHRMLIVAMGTASLLPSLLMTSLAKKTLAHGGYRPDSHTIACLLTESHAAGRGAGVVRTCGWPLQG